MEDEIKPGDIVVLKSNPGAPMTVYKVGVVEGESRVYAAFATKDERGGDMFAYMQLPLVTVQKVVEN